MYLTEATRLGKEKERRMECWRKAASLAHELSDPRRLSALDKVLR